MIIPPNLISAEEARAWTTSKEAPMTEVQAAQMRALCNELDEPFDTSLSEYDAQRRIIALKEVAEA